LKPLKIAIFGTKTAFEPVAIFPRFLGISGKPCLNYFVVKNALATFLVVAVVSANGQIWLSNTRIQGLQDDIQGLDDKIQDLRADMVAGDQMLRAEMVAGDQMLRAEMVDGFQSIRATMAAGDKSIRAELSNTNERLARVETRLTSVERVLYADFEPPAP